MPSLHQPSVMAYRNPALRPAVGALIEFLLERDYTTSARWAIADHAAVHGTLAGSLIEPEDEEAAEALFVAAMPAVPLDSPAWGREDVFLDVAMLAAGTHPLPFGEGPDAPDADAHRRFPGTPSLAERRALPPVSGGSPEYTDDDLEDHLAWVEQAYPGRAVAFAPGEID